MLLFAVLEVEVVDQVAEAEQRVVLDFKAFRLVGVLRLVVVEVHAHEGFELLRH